MPRSRTSPKKHAPPKPAPAPIGTVPMAGSKRAHPAIGLGLWARGRWKREDEERTRVVLGHALDVGVRWLDTAEVYGAGRSERVLGETLGTRSGIEPAPFVTTKVSWEHLRSAQVRAAVIGSLERLSRPSVDLCLVHAPDPRVPIAETMSAMEALWKEGRIQSLGVSNFTLAQLEEAQAALPEARISVNQLRYNLLEREEVPDPLREYCRDHQVVLEAYTPLLNGLLNGRFISDGKVPVEIRRGSPLFDCDRFPRTVKRVRRLVELADSESVPLASIALHWLERQGATPLFGASRPDQVDSNLAAWSVRPSIRALEEADGIVRDGRA